MRVTLRPNIWILWALMLTTGICLLVVATAESNAQSRLCRQLEAQLAATSSGGNSPQFRKYDRAVKTQRRELKKAKRNARRAGCRTGALSIFGNGNNRSQCNALISTIDRMEQNLAQLERRLARYDDGGRSPAVRARLLDRIEANGCRDRQEVVRRDDSRSRQVNILDQIFNGNARRRGPLDDENGNRIRTTLNDGSLPDLPGARGSLRTLCVRTCDGYYFPVSFAASEYDLDRDQKVCEAMCPGTEVRLYYHQVEGEESEDMISVAGEPYTELGTAFLYRQAGYRREKGCGCSPAKDFSIIAGEPKAEEATELEHFTPVPTPRPDPASDPETLANRDGKLTREAITRILTPVPDATGEKDSSERKVRVVGPVFLPDPEGAIDLQARDQKSVQ